MNVVKDILGMRISYAKWHGTKSLPLYLSGSYRFQKADIEGIECIIISPKSDLPTIPALKKQIARIQSVEMLPVVVQVDSLSEFRRKNMIENKIPFIVEEKQTYLPFIGTFLQAKSDAPFKIITHFMYSTQLLFLMYLYNRNDRLYLSNAGEKLPFSNMTITRASKQLIESKLFQSNRDGVKKILTCRFPRRELYERAKDYLISPIAEEGYVMQEDINEYMFYAGCTALSTQSMLNPVFPVDYAVSKEKIDKKKLCNELIDPEKQVRVELWNYDPGIFAKEKVADPISVTLSLMNNSDERVEAAIEEMLNNLWREENDWNG